MQNFYFNKETIGKAINLQVVVFFNIATHTYEVLDILNIHHSEKNLPLSIQTSAWMNHSFSFHQEAGELPFMKPMVYMSQPDTINEYDSFTYSATIIRL